MTFNNTYNNNDGQKKQYSPTIYSPYRMNNAESPVDKTCLTFTFWNNNLKLSISPKKETNNDEVSFDLENGGSIYLNHTKARILANEMREFLKDPTSYSNVGVPSGQNFVTLSNGKEFGVDALCLVIRKIDETGSVVSSFCYQFKSDYYYAVHNFTEDGAKFDRHMDPYATLEVEQMITLLEEYYKAMSGAVAYTVIDNMKYENTRVSNKLEAIGAKLGVEFGNKNPNGGRKYANNSYFNKPANESHTGGYATATLDDLESGE